MNRCRHTVLSLFSGILLSLPWLELFPGWILIVAFLPLLAVEDELLQPGHKTSACAFSGQAWLCFFAWNGLSCWWIGKVSVTGAILVIMLNAVCMSFVWMLAHQIRRKRGNRLGRLFLLTGWLAFEYLHSRLEPEWPWMNLGNGLAGQVQLIQWYEYTGVPGGTFWILCLNLLFFRLYKSLTDLRHESKLTLMLFIPALLLIPSLWSANTYRRYRDQGKKIQLILLQPDIDPYREKFGGLSDSAQIQILLQLTDSLLNDSTELVIGPETVLPPLSLTSSPGAHPYLVPFYRRAQNRKHLQFILGAITRTGGEDQKRMKHADTSLANQRDTAYNSALLIDGSDRLQASHKTILVSGVEKMPYSGLFGFLEKYLISLGGTAESLGTPENLSCLSGRNKLPVAAVICYESAFGEHVSRLVSQGARLLVVITNDGWWTGTPAPRQHLAFSRLRAIETRRSVARSANTGISALINQRGDLLALSSQDCRTALTGSLQANIHTTFYVSHGDYLGRIAVFLSAILLLLLPGRKLPSGLKNKKNPH
ncbi:MAG: apolipoprotein N-acyltransferase [Mangrovibacterium sp.]